MTGAPDAPDPRGYDLDEERERVGQEISRSVLMGTNPWMRRGRHVFHVLPGSARCTLCASPLSGGVAPIMKLVGKGPWPKNPKLCSMCFKDMIKHRSGAEIPCSMLFADVRGSTEMASQMTPTEFRARMDRYFSVASDVLIEHDGIVDKYVGDEVIGIFIPLLTGELHASRAIAAGRSLLGATADWIAIGVGVNTGIAFVGAIGPDDQAEFTAMGDPVNVTARLASAAGAGEMLVTAAAVESAQLDVTGREHRSLDLKGKAEATEVVVLSANR